MNVKLVVPARCEVRAVIRFLLAKGVKSIKNYRQLREVYDESYINVEIGRKCANVRQDNICLLHNNARRSAALTTVDPLQEFQWDTSPTHTIVRNWHTVTTTCFLI